MFGTNVGGSTRGRTLAVLSMALFLVSTSTKARTWIIYPDGSGDAPTIQAGVDSSATGDSVLVMPIAEEDSQRCEGCLPICTLFCFEEMLALPTYIFFVSW